MRSRFGVYLACPTSSSNRACWSAGSSICAMGRNARSVIAGWRTMSGRERTCCWISGARRSSPMTWVTRARVMPSRGAMSA
jgi:hypothetical protein